MLRRMWRAFWVAMREPVKRYAPDQRLTIRIDVESEDAMRQLDALAAKATELAKKAAEIREVVGSGQEGGD